MSSKKKIFVFYTLEFLMITIALLYSFQNFSMINGSDGINQYFPAFVYCGKYIREILQGFLHGKLYLTQYDFRIGMGDGIIPALNYYGVGDPFILLSSLVPVKYAAYAYTVVILIKMYVSGWGFIYYCKKRNIKETAILGGTAFYLANNYVFSMGFMFPSFLSVQISLPFLCSGIDEVIRNREKQKKISFSLILAVAYQALHGFYFLYIELLFAAIYALVQLICKYKSLKIFFSEIGILSVHIVIGVMSAGIFFIPAVLEYFSSSRGGDFVWLGWKVLLRLELSEYWGAFSSLIAPGSIMGVGLMIPSISIFLIFVAFKEKGNYKELKILGVILAFAYFEMRFTSYIAGGFTADIYYNRWIFCLMFLIAVMTSLGIEKMRNISDRLFIFGGGYLFLNIIYFLTLILVEGKYFSDGMKEQRRLVYFTYLLAAAITSVLFLGNTKKGKSGKEKEEKGLQRRERAAAVCVFLSVILTIVTVFGTFGKYGYGAKWNYKPYESARNEFLGSNAQLYPLDDDIFARKDIKGNVANEALYIGHNGVREYLSMVNQNIYEFYRQYVITSGLNGTNYILGGLNSRSGMEDLLAVRYYDDVKKDRIIENINQLPIAFTFDQYNLQDEAEKVSAIEKNADILNVVILDQEIEGMERKEQSDENNKAWTEESYDIEYINIDYSDTTIKVNPDSKIVITVESGKGGECYFYAKEFRIMDLARNTIYFDEVSCEFRNNSLQNRLKEHPAMICLGEIEKGKTIFEVTFTDNAEYMIEDIHMYTIDLNEVERQNAERRSGSLRNISIEKDCITGNIEVEKKKILFFGIPYSTGWSAYVDGKETEILNADYGFMAIGLEEGSHEIKLIYFTPGLKLGIVCTIFGLLLLVILYRIKKMHYNITIEEKSNGQ